MSNKSSILPTLRARAEKAGVPFNLTAATLPPVPLLCPALGLTLKSTFGCASDGSPSLDRLIPELGYVVGNVAWISFKANRIKNDSTLEELENVARWTRESLSLQGTMP